MAAGKEMLLTLQVLLELNGIFTLKEQKKTTLKASVCHNANANAVQLAKRLI